MKLIRLAKQLLHVDTFIPFTVVVLFFCFCRIMPGEEMLTLTSFFCHGENIFIHL